MKQGMISLSNDNRHPEISQAETRRHIRSGDKRDNESHLPFRDEPSKAPQICEKRYRPYPNETKGRAYYPLIKGEEWRTL